MDIFYSNKKDLYQEGYTIFKKLVPEKFSSQALRCINSTLGQINMPSQGICYNFITGINTRPEILDLFYKTPIKTITDQLIGKNQYDEINIAQIGLNFPVMESNVVEPTWHLDGLYESTVGAQKKPWNFTMLVGGLFK